MTASVTIYKIKAIGTVYLLKIRHGNINIP